MSTTNQHDTLDPNSLLYYAPRRLRDRANIIRSNQTRPGDRVHSIPTASFKQRDSSAQGQQAQDTVPPQSPFLPETLWSSEPDIILTLRVASRIAQINQILSVFARYAAVAGIAAVIAFLYVVNFTGSRDQAPPVKGGGASVAVMPQSEMAPIDQPPQITPPPKMAVAAADANINEPLSPAIEINEIKEHPVITASVQTTAANALLPTESPAPETARQIDPKEIAALIKRGKELLSIGDISAARLLLQRAAEAHDARAAFDLAGTYDPMVTEQFSRSGGGSDVALARVWYQRARDWGSPDAPRQLDALASTNR